VRLWFAVADAVPVRNCFDRVGEDGKSLEALDARKEFRGRGDARFLGGLKRPRDGALEGLRPQSSLEHDGVWL